jgi:DNA replication and repair protein RecF
MRFDQSFFSIASQWQLDQKICEVQVAYKAGVKKQVKWNKKAYDKLTAHIGKLPVVFISPYDGDLIAEGSDLRRKWIDGILSQLDKTYLEEIQRYARLLEQRHAVLRNMHEHRLFDPDAIEVWDAQLIPSGNYIHAQRKAFLNEFIPVFKRFYQEIGQNAEDVDVTYRSQLTDASFEDLMQASARKDALTQYTNVGIHKDDLLFTIKGHPVKKFGSQGQQKSFIIALRLAQFDWLKQHKGQKPVLLLDDIFDKLDNERVARLIALVSADYFGQVLITDTDPVRMQALFAQLPGQTQLFQIKDQQAIAL